MVKRIPVTAERQAELREDFRKNVPQHTRQGLREYLRWLQRHERPAERLCRAGVPTWIVHAEKGDGGLTVDERRTLEACPHAHLVTIPGPRVLHAERSTQSDRRRHPRCVGRAAERPQSSRDGSALS